MKLLNDYFNFCLKEGFKYELQENYVMGMLWFLILLMSMMLFSFGLFAFAVKFVRFLRNLLFKSDV